MARKKKDDTKVEMPASEPSPLRHLKPRLVPIRLSPFKQQFKNVANSAGFLSSLKKSIDSGGHRCPVCSGLMTFVAGADRDDGISVLACTQCPHVDHLIIEPAEAMERAKRFSGLAMQFLYVGMGLAVIASMIAVFNKSFFTLTGGVLLGGILWLQSAGFRYRAWQYENMRLYEKKAPIREWIYSEYQQFRGKGTGSGLTPT